MRCFAVAVGDDIEFALAGSEGGGLVEPDGAEVIHFLLEVAPTDFFEHCEEFMTLVGVAHIEYDVDARIGLGSEQIDQALEGEPKTIYSFLKRHRLVWIWAVQAWVISCFAMGYPLVSNRGGRDWSGGLFRSFRF